MEIKIILEKLKSVELLEIIKESNEILLNRLQEQKVKPDIEKLSKRINKIRKRKRRVNTKDFSRLDQFLRENYGNNKTKDLIQMAKNKGIFTDISKIYYRKKVLGLGKGWKKNPLAKQE